MEERSGHLVVHYTDENINSFLQSLTGKGSFMRHFSQTEDFFLKLKEEFQVGQFPIHHNIENKIPHASYLDNLKKLLKKVAPQAPEIFRGLTYFFDPEDIFHPCFFKLYKTEGRPFLFLIRLDLNFRPHYQTICERGGNDLTHSYTSKCLFLESICLPLVKIESESNKLKAFHLHTIFTETWIGEYGRGYFVQGIWMDNDLTKFASRLFLEPGKSIYPYYPFMCKYRTICAVPIWFSEAERNYLIPSLSKLIKMLEPYLTEIQSQLKENSFSENLPIFQLLKQKTKNNFPSYWDKIRIKAYINNSGQKEFEIEKPESFI